MTRISIHAIAFVVVVGLGFVACGSDARPLIDPSLSDEEQITRTLEIYFQESLYGDSSKAYDLLDSEMKKQCSEEKFAALTDLARVYFDEQNVKFDHISDIRISGDRATAKVHLTRNGQPRIGEPDTINVLKEGGSWRLTDNPNPTCRLG